VGLRIVRGEETTISTSGRRRLFLDSDTRGERKTRLISEEGFWDGRGGAGRIKKKGLVGSSRQ